MNAGVEATPSVNVLKTGSNLKNNTNLIISNFIIKIYFFLKKQTNRKLTNDNTRLETVLKCFF